MVNTMKPLILAKSGDTMKIKKITGKIEIKRRLEDLGFVAGENITVVSKLSGNFILLVKGSRIALDKSLAGNIMF